MSSQLVLANSSGWYKCRLSICSRAILLRKQISLSLFQKSFNSEASTKSVKLSGSKVNRLILAGNECESMIESSYLATPSSLSPRVVFFGRWLWKHNYRLRNDKASRMMSWMNELNSCGIYLTYIMSFRRDLSWESYMLRQSNETQFRPKSALQYLCGYPGIKQTHKHKGECAASTYLRI